ncbi:LysR family transcriptional regulator [Pinisolibacter aquiterrae]|jgi:DNA-binding transcriptional LysR family regulator|uniref:LysR family transcriptional regulator n=1 Tax=Pinisolibacter aquiterrae TaxID=2815579 RepID=UPI001C3D3136|nr:LysR family transcriptional regulator [Pinisolibacter aquiterrae]MBV5264270.1 LysR family transcriptional regulator [Pinisolibacter aquiterrae]MCC8236145.1 LysR family transcriptional regulator [Pinisolibacter aquiterrae]
MDIALARTFLAIIATGSFYSAAEKLSVTPTAVSARIKLLEDHLGRQLFVRNKSGARLTVAGERFRRHAASLVQTWESAQQEIRLPLGHTAGLAIGAELSLWDPMLLDWLILMRQENPSVALRVEIDRQERLIELVRDGALDLGVMHNPPHSDDLIAELLVDEKLVLATVDGSSHTSVVDNYVYVDWGPSFSSNHDAALPQFSNPPVLINFGPLARSYLLSSGGKGYFRLGSIEKYVTQGAMRLIPDAPEFSYSIYLVHAATREVGLIELARNSLRKCAVYRSSIER